MSRLILRTCLFAVCFAAALFPDSVMDAMGLAPAASERANGRAILQSLAWISGAFAAIAAINLFLWDGFVAKLAGRPVPPLLKNSFAVVVMIGCLTGIVGWVFGQDVTGIWATSGVIGIVLGFALRNMLQDVVTGIALNIDGSIKAGDWVQLHHRDFQYEQYGQVLDIGWRASRIQLENNNIVVIPNGLMGNIAVTNFAHADHLSRLQLEIVLDFDVPTERARRILLAGARAATEAPGIVADPAPSVVIGDPAEFGATYTVRFWGRVSENTPSTMQDAVMTRLLAQLHLAGLAPSVPKEDVFFERRPKRMLEHDEERDREEILGRTSLFGQTLEAAELASLSTTMRADAYAAGQSLVRQGEPGNSLFLVAEGLLDVMLTPEDGGLPLRVNRMTAGEVFGEMSLLTGEPRSTTVIASTDVVVYEITRDHFEALLALRPELAEQISTQVAEHRVRSDRALQDAADEELEIAARRLSEQILVQMKSLFAGLISSRSSGPREVAGGQ
jgi:small-conductance mechanosensitive channel